MPSIPLRDFGGESLPDRLDTPADHKRFLPAVGELVAVGPSDRVFGRPELTEEAQCMVRLGATEPKLKTFLPPACIEIEPFLVLRERNLHLDLLAAGDAALKRVRPLEHAADQRMVLRRNRIPELAIDEVMREVGAEP